jgi:hypothetical protein
MDHNPGVCVGNRNEIIQAACKYFWFNIDDRVLLSLGY